MNTLDTIRARRSVKHYDATHVMTDAEIKELLSLAMLSPTAFNLQHWRFLVVSDPTLRQEIRKVAWDQAQVTDSSLFIVLCADTQTWQNNSAQLWKNAPQEVQGFLVPAIDKYYRDKPQIQHDEALRSCGIAAQTLMLAAKAMGYDSCPMDGFDFDAVAKLIKLPDDHIISMCLAIGKGTVEAWDRPGKFDYEQVVINNNF
ncbi:nitroreductase family protein [Lentisphaera profundi]|uniref:Nitroreductase family protein n=1 Tax=Lentisphaera profundi TaxID=1658616 RepID=A0ABY7VTH9_9BACT|nr:nitroreductase family protein [Lentisphaera profundi]WDE97216.1 nitroreductase family protein [Lentisphaera profundi]